MLSKSTTKGAATPKTPGRVWYAAFAVVMAGLAAGVAVSYVIMLVTRGSEAEADVDAALTCAQRADTFTDYPLLYAGSEILGQPLRDCWRNRTQGRFAPDGTKFAGAADLFTFAYGSCTIPEGVESCPIPVAIVISPACASTIFPGVVREKIMVRGMEAFVKNDGSIRIETPTYKLTVYGPGLDFNERRDSAIRIAESLLPANALASGLTREAPLSTALGPSRACS